jgi:hypothetical protein
MKYSISVLFSCLVVLSFAQDSLSKWSIGVNASAGVGYRFFSNTSQGDQSFIDSRNENDEPIFTYCGGLFTEWDFHEKMSLSFGFHYSNYGDVIKFDTYWIDQDSVAHPFRIKYSTRVYKLGVPINFRYKFLTKEKITAFISCGVDMDFAFLVSHENEYLNDPLLDSPEKQFIKSTDPGFHYQVFTPSINLSVGVDFPFVQSKLRLEPFFKLELSNLSKNIGLRTHHFKGGINFAYLYNF